MGSSRGCPFVEDLEGYLIEIISNYILGYSQQCRITAFCTEYRNSLPYEMRVYVDVTCECHLVYGMALNGTRLFRFHGVLFCLR